MEKPTTSAFQNEPDTTMGTTSLLGAHPRNSLLQQRLHEPCPPLPSTGGQPVTSFQGPVLAPPVWARGSPPALPRDLLDLIRKPDTERIVRDLVFWMIHIDDGCDCPDENVAGAASPRGRNLQWCRAMEDFMVHATQCTAGNLCAVANCAVANSIFRHSEKCTLTWCFVCAAARPFRHNTAGRSAVSLDDDGISKVQAARELRNRIKRCVQSFVHASQCRDTDCRLSSCQQMKDAISHSKNCKEASHGGCNICKMLVSSACHHAEECNESKCLVPFCPQVRQKWGRPGQQQQDIQRQQFERRRAAILNRVMPPDRDGGAGASSSNQGVHGPPSSMLMDGSLYPAGMGIKGDSGPLRAIQETLKSAQANILDGSAAAPNGTVHSVPTFRAAVWSGQSSPHRIRGSMVKPYEQLVQALNSPPSPEQQHRVANIVRGNPELALGFLRLARAENNQPAMQQHYLQQSQSVPTSGQAFNRRMYQAVQGGQFQGEQAAVLQLMNNTCNLKQTAISGTRSDLNTAGNTGTKADVVISVSNIAKMTYSWKTWIPEQFRFLQRSPWQCKFAVYLAALLIAGVLFFFFGVFIGNKYS